MSQTIQKSQNILIVEDDPQMVKLLSMYLKNSGYTVSVAYNGEEALNILKELTPDIIIEIMTGQNSLYSCQ